MAKFYKHLLKEFTEDQFRNSEITFQDLKILTLPKFLLAVGFG